MDAQNVVVKQPKVLKHKGGKFTPIPLKSALQVSIFLEKLVNMTLKGEMEVDTASRLTYMSGMLLKSIEQSRTERQQDESDRFLGLQPMQEDPLERLLKRQTI
jgi:hypothetical protein